MSSLGLDILFKRSPHGNSDNLILAVVLRGKDRKERGFSLRGEAKKIAYSTFSFSPIDPV